MELMPLEGIVAGPASSGELGPAFKSVVLSQGALLAVFDLDHDRAEEKYWALYQKLVRYFAWNRTADPEDLAQEALLRGLRRLRQGQQITVPNPESYFFGIARNLLRESWAMFREEQFADHSPEPDSSLFRDLNRVEQLVFLKECLRDLAHDDSKMIIAYLGGEGDAWAREAGVQPSTLRSRVHRARKRLELLTMPKRRKLGSSPIHCDLEKRAKRQAFKKEAR